MTANGKRRERMVAVGGDRLFVREQGEGTPILLINGLGSNADMWAAVESRLAGAARTVAYDLPGSGRSPTPHAPLTIAGLARGAARLLDALGYARADVLGFSLGGLVAQQLAHDEPGLVRRMALAGSACGWGSVPPTYRGLALLSMPMRYYSRAFYWQTNHLLGVSDRQLLRRLPALTESRLQHPPPLRGYAYQLTAGAMWSSLPWLHTVQAPTLVVNGLDDEVVPAANSVQLARLLPESRLHLLSGYGHLFVFDPEGPAIPLLEGFFASARHEDSPAWADGIRVESDEAVEAAFASTHGAFPHRAFSDAYRRFVEADCRRRRGPARVE
jgi:poly(3-hydroxyoctanoate) depolymerase